MLNESDPFLFTALRVDCTMSLDWIWKNILEVLWAYIDLNDLLQLEVPPKNCSKSDPISGQKLHGSLQQID